MFTGIIEELGEVVSLKGLKACKELSVKGLIVTSSLKIGESIAVNGVCLTATWVEKNIFKAFLSPETLKCTNLIELKKGHKVNLERAVRLGERMAGHIVTGHIDAGGTIFKRKETAGYLEIEVDIPGENLNLVIPKGSIAIDGVSLTIAALRGNIVSLAIIPHTARMTTLGFKKKGEKVNLEYDLIGKYLWRFSEVEKKRPLTIESLKEAGF
jgi:riboflavin synthase